MKPKLFLASLTACFIALIFSCHTEINPEANPLYPEHAQLSRVLLYGGLQDDAPGYIIEEYEYNPKGLLKKVVSPLYDDGKINGISQYTEYEYNQQSQLIKISTYNYNLNAGFINLKNNIYTYSADGKKIKETLQYPEINTSEYFLFHYDEERLIRKEYFDAKNQLESYHTFSYNAEDRLIEEMTYAFDHALLRVEKHHYSQGNNIRTDVYPDLGTEKLREITRTFDENNNLLILESEELSSYSSASNYKLKYEYKEN